MTIKCQRLRALRDNARGARQRDVRRGRHGGVHRALELRARAREVGDEIPVRQYMHLTPRQRCVGGGSMSTV